jgi:hypothetical protein
VEDFVLLWQQPENPGRHGLHTSFAITRRWRLTTRKNAITIVVSPYINRQRNGWACTALLHHQATRLPHASAAAQLSFFFDATCGLMFTRSTVAALYGLRHCSCSRSLMLEQRGATAWTPARRL